MVLVALRGWGLRSCRDWSLPVLQHSHFKLDPFPSGSFSPLPHLPETNKISFSLFRLGVPFHLPFGTDGAGVTGFRGGGLLAVLTAVHGLGREGLLEPNSCLFLLSLGYWKLLFHFFQWFCFLILSILMGKW